MSECNLTTCPHVRDLETMLKASEANGLRWMRERDRAIREHKCCKVWANTARKQRDEAYSLKDAWEALFATLDERGLPFDTVAVRAVCDLARGLIANKTTIGGE